jgi:hypothetical protein
MSDNSAPTDRLTTKPETEGIAHSVNLNTRSSFHMKIRSLAVLSVIILVGLTVACGGGSSASAPTPIPTPVPVSYSGTYAGRLDYTLNGTPVLWTNVVLNTTQQGGSLMLSDMQTNGPAVPYRLGMATLQRENFDGSFSYGSSGCGTVTSHYFGYFNADGSIMNLTVRYTSVCGVTEAHGELRR